jgi:hypothetical protein
MTRGPILSEKVEQARILELLRAIGAAVYVSGTVRPRTDAHHGTCQTPGIPDLCAFLPGPPGSHPPAYTLLFIECKRAGGRAGYGAPGATDGGGRRGTRGRVGTVGRRDGGVSA